MAGPMRLYSPNCYVCGEPAKHNDDTTARSKCSSCQVEHLDKMLTERNGQLSSVASAEARRLAAEALLEAGAIKSARAFMEITRPDPAVPPGVVVVGGVAYGEGPVAKALRTGEQGPGLSARYPDATKPDPKPQGGPVTVDLSDWWD